MVPPTGETLNTLFEVFEDWDYQLKQANVEFDLEEPAP